MTPTADEPDGPPRPRETPAIKVPSLYRDLVERWGPPLSVEDARERFGDLVRSVEAGHITLLVCDGREWAALVPLDRLSVPVRTLGQVPGNTARAHLRGLVRVVDRQRSCFVVLDTDPATEHPVAGLVPVDDLLPC
ncbi:hypothetical protein ACQEU3_38265 [Spirillospora sp. CA-253888]